LHVSAPYYDTAATLGNREQIAHGFVLQWQDILLPADIWHELNWKVSHSSKEDKRDMFNKEEEDKAKLVKHKAKMRLSCRGRISTWQRKWLLLEEVLQG
jgi:hypothetical protein